MVQLSRFGDIMNRERVIIKTSFIGIIFNIILVIFKLIVGILSNSIAIILDAVNNLTDAISEVATIIGTKLANKSPDRKHPFGHGRIEYFTSIIIATFIIIAGILAMKESITKIIAPGSVDYSVISLIVIGVAVISKFIFGKLVKKVGMKIESHSLIAVGVDALMDSVLSLTTFIAGILNILFSLNIEGYLGVVISLFIIKSGIGIFHDAMDIMIGKRFDKTLTDKIKKEIISYKEVLNVCDLSLHNYGPNKTVGTVHIEIDCDTVASKIHTLTRSISASIYDKYGIFMTIGIYASNTDGKSKEIKGYLNKILKEYDYIKQLHGFYIDYDTNNIYFDLIIDFGCNNKVDIKDIIISKMKLKYSSFNYNVIIDDDISD